MGRLARWLGPWTAEDRRPPEVLRRSIRVVGERAFDAWIYRPRREPQGMLLLVPGLHYLGPADPRLDRFLAVLANAGLLVMCPFLPEFRKLRVGPSLVSDTLAAFDALVRLPDAPPTRAGVFSVSFGSFPSLYLAASEERAARLGPLTLFGGYASFEDVIRFSLEGNPEQPFDPLNRPVVFLNLIDHFEGVPEDRTPLARAWVSYVRQTWGKPEMKQREMWEPVARRIAAHTQENMRQLFLIGTGAEPGSEERVGYALERGHPTLAHLDTRPACARMRQPVTIVHGRDDDVIPHTHAQMLADAMPAGAPARVLLTGLYGHTGHGVVAPSAVAQELRSMVGIVESIIDSGRQPLG